MTLARQRIRLHGSRIHAKGGLGLGSDFGNSKGRVLARDEFVGSIRGVMRVNEDHW